MNNNKTIEELIYLAIDNNIIVKRNETRYDIIKKLIEKNILPLGETDIHEDYKYNLTNRTNITTDIIKYNILHYLPIEGIRDLCNTNKEINEYCKSNQFWIFLIKRDYKHKYDYQNAKLAYYILSLIHKMKNDHILMAFDYIIKIVTIGYNIKMAAPESKSQKGYKYYTADLLKSNNIRSSLEAFEIMRRTYILLGKLDRSFTDELFNRMQNIYTPFSFDIYGMIMALIPKAWELKNRNIRKSSNKRPELNLNDDMIENIFYHISI